MFNHKEKRYSVWSDNESNKQTYKSFDRYIDAYHYASNFVHKYDNEPYRVILHIDDTIADETVDTFENSNNPCDINEELQFRPYQNFEEKSNKKKKHDSKDEKKHKHDKPKHKKEHNDDDNDGKELSDDYKMIESQIEDFFTKDGVDIAPYAYKLFNTPHEEGKDTDEMKNARSLFYKKLYHEENSEGYVYGFTSEELVHLQSLISSENNLSEQRIYDFFERIIEGYHKNSYLINENL